MLLPPTKDSSKSDSNYSLYALASRLLLSLMLKHKAPVVCKQSRRRESILEPANNGKQGS